MCKLLPRQHAGSIIAVATVFAALHSWLFALFGDLNVHFIAANIRSLLCDVACAFWIGRIMYVWSSSRLASHSFAGLGCVLAGRVGTHWRWCSRLCLLRQDLTCEIWLLRCRESDCDCCISSEAECPVPVSGYLASQGPC